jgi:flagellar biosynthesis protein FliP
MGSTILSLHPFLCQPRTSHIIMATPRNEQKNAPTSFPGKSLSTRGIPKYSTGSRDGDSVGCCDFSFVRTSKLSVERVFLFSILTLITPDLLLMSLVCIHIIITVSSFKQPLKTSSVYTNKCLSKLAINLRTFFEF